MLANEKEFDKVLEKIGKGCLTQIISYDADAVKSKNRIYEILREMRDIAAVKLKAGHEIKNN